MTAPSHRRLAIGAAASVTAEAVNRGLPLVTMSVAQARLGTAAFGSALFAISLVDCTSPFIEAGTGSYGQIQIGARGDDNRSCGVVLGDVLTVRLLNIVFAGIGLLLLTTLKYREYAPLVLALTFMMPSSAVDMSYYHIGTQRVWVVSALAVLSKVLLLTAVVSCVWTSADATLFAVALAAGNTLISVGTAVIAIRQTRPIFPNWQRVRSIYVRILPFAATIIMFYALDKFDFLLVGAYANPTDVGLYGGASRLFISIQALVAPLVVAAGAEMLASNDPAKLRQYIQIGLGFATLVVLPIAVGVWFAGGPLLSLVFDPSYLAAGPVFATLCAGVAPFIVLIVYGVYVLQPRGRTRQLCLALGLGLVCGIALALALRPLFGLVGVAVGAAAAKLVAAGLTYRFADPELKKAPAERYWTRNLAAAAAMAAILAALRLPGFFGPVTVGGLVYGSMVLFLNRRLVARLGARLKRRWMP